MSFKSVNDNVKVDMVSTDQMTDEERRSILDREASVDAIPDLDELTGTIYEILEYLERPATRKLLKSNESAVKMQLNNKYTNIPLGLITLLLDEETRVENIERMLQMFETLREAKSGKVSLAYAEKKQMDGV